MASLAEAMAKLERKPAPPTRDSLTGSVEDRLAANRALIQTTEELPKSSAAYLATVANDQAVVQTTYTAAAGAAAAVGAASSRRRSVFPSFGGLLRVVDETISRRTYASKVHPDVADGGGEGDGEGAAAGGSEGLEAALAGPAGRRRSHLEELTEIAGLAQAEAMASDAGGWAALDGAIDEAEDAALVAKLHQSGNSSESGVSAEQKAEALNFESRESKNKRRELRTNPVLRLIVQARNHRSAATRPGTQPQRNHHIICQYDLHI